MVEKQKTEAIAAKRHKDRKRINLFNRKEENYEGDNKDNIDLN